MTAEWKGSPAEWDAERDRIISAMRAASPIALVSAFYETLATATMPPRPVEPPSVVTASGWTVTWDGKRLIAKNSWLTESFEAPISLACCVHATDDEYMKIRALRDGPTARYEVCGWQVRRGASEITTFSVSGTFNADACQRMAEGHAKNHGGTAHAIYKRVGGEG